MGIRYRQMPSATQQSVGPKAKDERGSVTHPYCKTPGIRVTDASAGEPKPQGMGKQRGR